MTTTPTTADRLGGTAAESALSDADGPTDVPLLEETIGDNFDRIVATNGARDALVECATGRRWTYAQLGTDVDTLALGLIRRGIEKGDRIGIWASNHAEWTLLQYASAKIGAILVCINPAYRVAELQYVLQQSGIRLLVAAPWTRSVDHAAMIEQVRSDCPALEQVVIIGSDAWCQLLVRTEDRAPLADAEPR